MNVVPEALDSDETEPPPLDSWDAIRALQTRLADGTATDADREAFRTSFGDQPSDEEHAWLNADLGGVGNDPELDGGNA